LFLGCGAGGWEESANGTNFSGEGKLSVELGVGKRVGGELAGGDEECDGNGEVETGTLLGEIGG
jgi:hypothetical protein